MLSCAAGELGDLLLARWCNCVAPTIRFTCPPDFSNSAVAALVRASACCGVSPGGAFEGVNLFDGLRAILSRLGASGGRGDGRATPAAGAGETALFAAGEPGWVSRVSYLGGVAGIAGLGTGRAAGTGA